MAKFQPDVCLFGANIPYTDRELPVWSKGLVERYRPEEVTLTSFASSDTLEFLHELGTVQLWHIRPRTGPVNRSWSRTYAEQGANILTYRSWPSERSMQDAIDTLLVLGVPLDRICVLMGNEPCLEWAPEWASPEQARVAANEYADWYFEQGHALRSRYGGIELAPAPIGEGDAARELAMFETLSARGVYRDADRFADHNYFVDRVYDDPEWGGRGPAMMQHIIGWPMAEKGRCRNTETNAGNELPDPNARAAAFAGYFAWAARSGWYDSVSAFTLPGAPDDGAKPAWWYITPQTIDAIRAEMPNRPMLPRFGDGEMVLDPALVARLEAAIAKIESMQAGGSIRPELAQMVAGGETLTVEQAHAKRWALHALPALPELPPYYSSFGFETAWRNPANAWWGAPLTLQEDTLDNGDGSTSPLRIFTNACVVYRGDGTAEVLR